MKTSSLLKDPVEVVITMMCSLNFFTASRVLLQTFDWLIFRKMMTDMRFSIAIRVAASLADRVNSKILLDNLIPPQCQRTYM